MSEINAIDNPYPGLRAFGFADREVFFGREKQSEELLRRLRRNRFLAVVGTSGSGKSSLVRAGLLPLISKGLDADLDAPWTVAYFRPGKDPIYNMAAALTTPVRLDSLGAQVEGPSLATDDGQLKATVIETTLRRSAIGLADYFKRWQRNGRERFLICIDQFEELFRFKEQSPKNHPEDQAAAFVKLLLEAAYDNSVSAYVLLTMRSDFLGDCAQFRDLPEAINRGQYLIPRMTRDEQRSAITLPAARHNAEITPRLAQRLLNDVGDNPDHLPLLQHSLMRIWDQWAANPGETSIDLNHYELIGTMQEALSKHAQETFDVLPDNRHKKIAERLFKALTETVVNNREVRRPAELQEICNIAGADVQTVTEVVNHFRAPGRSFLMPPHDQPLASDTIIDVAHESLIRCWTQLKLWVEEEARSKAIYQRLADAGTRRYDKSQGASLWRDPDLQFALHWRDHEQPNDVWARRYDPHFKEAMAFLAESETERERQIQIEKEWERRELERKERERQRELEAAQAELLTQQRIAEAERSRAQEAQARQAAEHEIANTERRRATEQAKYVRRLAAAVVALIIMFLTASVIAVYAISQRKRAGDSVRRSTELSTRLGAELNHSQELYEQREKAIKQAEKEKLAAEDAKNLAQAASRRAQQEKQHADQEKRRAELARNMALRESKRAEDATKIAEDRATELQNTLDNLTTTQEKLDLERDGFENLEKGETDLAIEKFDKLRRRYENDAMRWSWASYNFGSAQRQAKDYEKAGEAYELAIAKQKSIVGETDLSLAPAVERLAQVRYEQGDYPRAEAAYELLQKIIKDAGRRVTLDRKVNFIRDQARLFHNQGRDARSAAADANAELNEAQKKVYRITFESTTPSGSVKPPADQQRELEEAKSKVKELETKIDNYEKVIEAKYSQAESSYKEVVKEREALLPKVDPDLIDAYSALGAFYQDQAQLHKVGDKNQERTAAQTKANQFFELARVLRENKITPGKNELEKLSVVLDAYDQQDRQGPVTDLLTRKLELERSAGKSIDETLMGLVASLYKQGLENEKQPPEDVKNEEDKKAATRVRSASELDKKVPWAPRAQRYLEELFINLRIAGKSTKDAEIAEEYQESAYPLLDILITKHKNDEAEKLFQYLLTIQENTHPANHDGDGSKYAMYRRIMLLNGMAWLWFRGENYSKSEELAKQVIDLTGKTFGVGGDWENWASYGLALTYARQGRDEDAVRLFLRIQKLFENTIGPQQRQLPGTHEMRLQILTGYSLVPSDNDYLGTLSNLALLYAKHGNNLMAEQTYKELLAASKWLITNNNSLGFTGSDEQRKKEINDRYEGWYADALERYSEFLNWLGRMKESRDLNMDASAIRSRIGPSKHDEFGVLRTLQ